MYFGQFLLELDDDCLINLYDSVVLKKKVIVFLEVDPILRCQGAVLIRVEVYDKKCDIEQFDEGK
jgi:hypothetical protein